MKDAFLSMIDRLPGAGEAERGALEGEIWRQFGVDRALLALDMSHFSLTVRRSGILRYLGLIRRMQTLSAPLVAAQEGTVVEFHADNLMAVFPDAGNAVEAALAINKALCGELAPDGKPLIEVGIGIDYGRFLLVEGHCYGDTVNVAFKLGEDIARAGEILLTRAARERLPRDFRHGLEEQHVAISGIDIHVFNVRHKAK